MGGPEVREAAIDKRLAIAYGPADASRHAERVKASSPRIDQFDVITVANKNLRLMQNKFYRNTYFWQYLKSAARL
jgi:hypothetical protein